MKKIFLIMLPFLVLSCSREEIEIETLEDIDWGDEPVYGATSTTYDQGIDRETETLLPTDAKSVAAIFLNGGKNTASRSLNDTYNVETVYDSVASLPLMYIVNWGDDQGFALVSATKKAKPILAHSETGHFDSSLYNEYFEDYKTGLREAIATESDSLRQKYAIEWALYEKPIETPLSRALGTPYTTNVDSLKQAEIARKEALGYTYVGPISSVLAYLSTEDYALLVADISSHTNSAYDYSDVSLFFVKNINTSVGPLMETKWHQGSPFNVEASNSLAGCGPIAVAQIMFYHKYPATYDWNNIPVSPTESDILNTSFKEFILDVRSNCNANYSLTSTTTTYLENKRALQLFGYTVSDGGTPNTSNFMEQIVTYQSPIWVGGFPTSSSLGHIWVCDGYMYREFSGSISYITSEISLNGSAYEDYPLDSSIFPGVIIEPSFHMNLGWGGSNNGWYTSFSYIGSGSTYYSSNQSSMFISK